MVYTNDRAADVHSSKGRRRKRSRRLRWAFEPFLHVSGIVCRGFDYTHSEILFRPHVCVGACGTTDGAAPGVFAAGTRCPAAGRAESGPQSGAVTPDDWQILLVNRWNPLPVGYTFERTKLKYGHSVDSRAYPDLQEMMDDCRAAGLDPVICSSYRIHQASSRSCTKTSSSV